MRAIAESIKKALTPLMAFPAPETRISDAIERVIANRPPSRRSDWFRVGSVNNKYECNRRVVLVGLEKIYTDRTRRDTKGSMIMDLGSAIHEMVQEQLLGPSGQLLGHWRCPKCHQRHPKKYTTYPEGFCQNKITITLPDGTTREEECKDEQAYLEGRGGARWIYEEIRLKDELRNLSGRIDGIWLEVDGKWYILEIKSIDTFVFNDLRKFPVTKAQAINLGDVTTKFRLVDTAGGLPRDYHVNQASIYAGLAQEMCLFDEDFPLDVDKFGGVLISYVDRNSMSIKTYLKECVDGEFAAAEETISRWQDALSAGDYEVRDDPEEEQARIEENRRIAFRFSASCSDRNHRKAKECPWRTICFPYKKVEKNMVEYLKDD